MLRAPHFSHAAFSEALDELIRAQGTSLSNLSPESVQDASRRHREQGADVVRIEHQQRRQR
jgi:hypothetical protein